MQPQSLSDKVAIVTGGSRGIGAAIAIELAHRGAHVLISYNTALEKAEEVAERIRKLGRQANVEHGSSANRARRGELLRPN